MKTIVNTHNLSSIRRFSLLAVATVLVAGAVQAGPITFEVLTPMSTFLLSDGPTSSPVTDTPGSPDIILLSSLGISPGDTITLSAQGMMCFDSGCTFDLAPTTLGAFSTSNTLQPISTLNRITGIIGGSNPPAGGTPFASGLTNDGVATDIAQDFLIPGGGTTFTVPTGAVYLFLGIADSHYADNGFDSNQGTTPLGVNVSSVAATSPEPGTLGFMLTGIAGLIAFGRKRLARS